MKRLLDIFVSGILLLVLLIPGMFVLILLRLTGEGKIFYLQERVGLAGKRFKVYKLATMLENSLNMGNKDITVRNDPRVLPLGQFLRKTKLNELPQLFNVLKGDMSLVGWRPLVETSFSYYPQHVQDHITEVKPGLTGIGSMFFRDEESLVEKSDKKPLDLYTQDIAPHKGELELWYNKNRSFVLDLKVMFCTAWVVLMSKSKMYETLFPDLPQPPADGEIMRLRGL